MKTRMTHVTEARDKIEDIKCVVRLMDRGYYAEVGRQADAVAYINNRLFDIKAILDNVAADVNAAKE